MCTVSRCVSCLLLALAIAVPQHVPAGESGPDVGAPSAVGPVLAVLPFADHTDEADAKTLFVSLIETRLARGNFDLITTDDIRGTLRRLRIRSSGGASTAEAAAIVRELGARYLLLGSLDFFLPGVIPEAGFSARLLDTETMRIVWAASVAATGEDYAGLFGIGRVTSMEMLAEKLVEKAFAAFEETVDARRVAAEPQPGSPVFAVVPFDNLSENRRAGEIVSSITLTQLVARGAEVVEPGAVLEIFRAGNRSPRGEIDLALLEQVRSALNAAYVITGTVDRFRPGLPAVESSAPEIELGGRLIDARSGRIVAAHEVSGRGSDSNTLSAVGSRHSLGALAGKMIDRLLDKLDVDGHKRLAEGK